MNAPERPDQPPPPYPILTLELLRDVIVDILDHLNEARARIEALEARDQGQESIMYNVSPKGEPPLEEPAPTLVRLKCDACGRRYYVGVHQYKAPEGPSANPLRCSRCAPKS